MKKSILVFLFLLCLAVLPGFVLADEKPVSQTPPQPLPSQNNQLPPQVNQPVPPPTSAPQGPQAQSPAQPTGPERDVFQGQLTPIQTPTGSPDQPVEIQTNLEGITIGAKGARAVINGQIYKEGEEKMGIKILQIKKKEVDILINQAIKRRLSMLPGETKDLPLTPEESANLENKGAPQTETPAQPTDNEANKQQSKEPTYV